MEKVAETTEKKPSTELLHNFDNAGKTSIFTSTFLTILIVAILLGIGTGFFLAGTKGTTVQTTAGGGVNTNGGSVTRGAVVGSDDTKTFKDVVEGELAEGGKDGEGQFHLIRPGGESQYVYLTSSTIDLSQYVKRKVKINGQTHEAQKVGWLMDVGRLEVLE